jgi:hypothetical protein
MNNVRNWASAAVVAGLILLAPIIAFIVVVTGEMLGDLVAWAGAPAIWPVVAGAMAWVLLRKFGGQPHTSQLRSEEVRPDRTSLAVAEGFGRRPQLRHDRTGHLILPQADG